MNELTEKAANTYSRVKLLKFILKLFAGMFTSFGFFIILLILMIVVIVSSRSSFSVNADYTTFSQGVEQWRNQAYQYCKEEGIEYYTDVVLAIMQVSTGGGFGDVMKSSNKESNELYGKEDGDIINTSYSIRCGVKEVKTLLDMCGVVDLYDTANLYILYQSYEFDRGFVSYAKENGGYSADTAKNYKDKHELRSRNSSFAISVAMYVDVLTGGIKEFEAPLALSQTIKQFDDSYKYKLYKGVKAQPVLCAADGIVVNIARYADYTNVMIQHDDYMLHYNYLSDVSVEVGWELKKGRTIGIVTYMNEYDSYVCEFGIEKNGEFLNPDDYINKLMIEKEELSEDAVKQGESVARYAENAIGNIPYLEGGSDVNGCDRLGFIKNIYATYISDADEDYYNLPDSSYEDLINSRYVSYKLDKKTYIRPQIMYEGDVIIYHDENGNYCDAGVYVGKSRVIHMTEDGVVRDYYNFKIPAILIRFVGRKGLGLLWPLPGYTRANITSDFDPDRENPVTGIVEAHKGTDIAAPTGTEVVAAGDGTVIASAYNDSCGYHIIIDHHNGIKTYYYHSSQLIANTGDEVKAGDVIMLVGSTGESTGSHLHFGVNIDGEWVDAMTYTYKNEEE
jgi:murein DD-endopeptidase MepM/ murein hydrolase activator NlpD